MLQSDEPYHLPDVRACGIVLIEMMAKKTPWPSTDSSKYSDWKKGILQPPFDLISKTQTASLKLVNKLLIITDDLHTNEFDCSWPAHLLPFVAV